MWNKRDYNCSRIVVSARRIVHGDVIDVLKWIASMHDSPIPKLLTHSSNSVTKLTDRKIRWIREKMKKILSTNDIALSQ